MKIDIVSVQPQGSELRIVFANPEWYATPEGRRALRILKLHCQGGHGVRDGAFFMHEGASATAINTTEKCQAEMRRLMRVPLRFDFSDLRVGATNALHVFGTMSEVNRARGGSGKIWLSFKVTANMAFVTPDIAALEKALNCSVIPVKKDNCSVKIVLYLTGNREHDNPWLLARRIQSMIRRTVT